MPVSEGKSWKPIEHPPKRICTQMMPRNTKAPEKKCIGLFAEHASRPLSSILSLPATSSASLPYSNYSDGSNDAQQSASVDSQMRRRFLAGSCIQWAAFAAARAESRVRNTKESPQHNKQLVFRVRPDSMWQEEEKL